MNPYSKSRCSDAEVAHGVRSAHAVERGNTAESIAWLGEFQDRRLHVPEGFPDALSWCMAELHLAKSSAYKRLRAARAARRFPVLFPALADGRLHVSAIVLLEPHLTQDNVDELVTAATHQTCEAIELLLAKRWPRPDVPTTLWSANGTGVKVPVPTSTLAAEDVAKSTQEQVPVPESLAAATASASPTSEVPALLPAEPPVSDQAPPPAPPSTWSRLAPLSPGRHEFRTTLDEETVVLLRKAQDLLSHVIPSRAAPDVLKRVLADWVRASERRKYGLTDQPRVARSGAPDSHSIPAAVQRAVMRRDGHRCTFVSADGRRCESRTRLEFDHVRPLARGGQTSVDNLRMRCRAHNFHEAEKVFGKRFMAGKLAQAKRAGS